VHIHAKKQDIENMAKMTTLCGPSHDKRALQ